jgi:DNA-binding CsgD family transcriptional regulator
MTDSDFEKDVVSLSERELDVLRCVTRGATNQQIATELDITLNTVKVHLRNIFAKINVSSRTEASLYAIRMGLLDVEMLEKCDIAPPAKATEATEAAEATETELDEPVSETGVSEETGVSPPGGQLTEPSAVETRPHTVQGEHASEPATRVEPLPVSPAQPPQTQAQETATPSPAAPAHAAPAPTFFSKTMVITAAVVLVLLLVGIIVWTTWLFASEGTRSGTAATSTPEPTGDSIWISSTVMQIPRTDFGLASYGRRLYVIGGRTAAGVSEVVERYDPDSETWTQLSSKPTPVSDVQVEAIGGKLYVAGGELESGDVSDVFEVYDPSLDKWDRLEDMPEPRSQYASATLNGKLYLFGGWDGSAYCDEVWIFDPDEGAWDSGTPMPEPRGRMGIAVVENEVHLIGGRDNDGVLTVHRAYDQTRDRTGLQPWNTLAPLPAPAEDLVTTPVIGDMYTFNPASREGLFYRPRSDSWHPFDAQLPDGTMTLQGNLFGTDIHLFGTSSGGNTISFFHLRRQIIYRTHLPLVPVD